MNHFTTEVILLELENLLQRVKNLPLNSRTLVLEKIRIELFDEFKFKDFGIPENDAERVRVLEISQSDHDESGLKTITFNDESSTVGSDNENFVSFAQPTIFEEFLENEEITRTNNSVVQSEIKISVKPPKTIFLCYFCGKQFRRKTLFNTHLYKHENECIYECATCSVCFQVKRDLIKHIKTHAKKTDHFCPVCKKSLVNSRTLENHFQVIHIKEKKFTCSKCNYFAYSIHTLKEHYRVKHDKRVTKYACVICKKVYNARTLLKVHLRSHTGERNFKCEKCSAAFLCSGQLTNHIKSVHGELKFSCEVCSKGFKTIYKLQRHSLIHTRVKPFSCPFCENYASNTQGNLTKHVKTVHQMKNFSYLNYRKMIQGEIEEVEDEWISNAESTTNYYFEQFSRNNIAVDIDNLKQNHQLKSRLGSTSNAYVNNLIEIDAVLF